MIVNGLMPIRTILNHGVLKFSLDTNLAKESIYHSPITIIISRPGMAFGTGNHETTRLCLEEVLNIESNLISNSSLLDLGVGRA